MFSHTGATHHDSVQGGCGSRVWAAERGRCPSKICELQQRHLLLEGGRGWVFAKPGTTVQDRPLLWGCPKAHGPTQHTGASLSCHEPTSSRLSLGWLSPRDGVEGTTPPALGRCSWQTHLSLPVKFQTDFRVCSFALLTPRPGKGPGQLYGTRAGAREAGGALFSFSPGSSAGGAETLCLCLPCRWKGRLSRALASSLWRSCTTPQTGSCTPAAPAPTRSLPSAASPPSSECPCSVTAPTRRPSMPPRYCGPGSVLPSGLQVGKPWVATRSFSHHHGSAGACMEERRGLGTSLGGGDGGVGSPARKHRGTGLKMTPPLCGQSPLFGCTQRDLLVQSCRSDPDLCPGLSVHPRCLVLELISQVQHPPSFPEISLFIAHRAALLCTRLPSYSGR